MKMQRVRVSALSIGFVILTVFMLNGCASQGYSVITSTATTIGVNISQQPTSGVVDATLGYKRAEFAFVPTNRNGGELSKDSLGNGASESGDVIMELRYSGIFSVSDTAGVYQRLAVGKTAVAQGGAAVMFAKGADGKTDDNAVKALNAINKIPAVVPAVEADKAKIGTKYNEIKNNPDDAAKFNTAAKCADQKYKNIGEFLSDGKATADQVKKVKDCLTTAGITIN